MEQKLIENEHCLIMENRRSLKITGVSDVSAYDEHVVQMIINGSSLEVCGEGLHIKQLVIEKGIIEIEGLINSIDYQEKRPGSQESFWKRLLR